MSLLWAAGYADLVAEPDPSILGAQLRGLRDFADSAGLTLVGLYADTADSAGAEFSALTASLRRGGISHLIVPSEAHLDRGRPGTGWIVKHVLGSYYHLDIHVLTEPATMDLARTG